MRRVLLIVLAAAVPPLVAWLGGFDFDQRGFKAAYTFACSMFAGLFVWVFSK